MKKKILLVILFLCCIFMKVYIKDSLTADLGNSAVEQWKANPFMYSLGYCPGYSYITCYSCFCGQVNYQTCNYCTCCCHPTHTYTSSYSDYNASYHYAYCVCGSSQLQSHTLTTLSCGYQYCTKCNRYVSGSHTYTSSYSSYNSSYHYAYCSCGASTLQTHTLTTLSCGYQYCTKCNYTAGSHSYTYVNNGASGHTRTCTCGDTATYSHTLVMCCDAGQKCSLCDYKDHETCEPHVCSYTAHYVYSTSSRHYGYCICGAQNSTYSSHTLVNCDNYTYKVCSLCGYKNHSCNYFYVTTIVSPTGGGTVSGGGRILRNNSVTITATPATGYKFVRWITYNYSGTEVNVLSDNTSASQTFTMPTQSMTALAVFSNRYTVSFDSQEGSACGNKTVKYSTQYGTLPTPTRAGYTFNGWYTASSGGSLITATTTVTTAANHTLYAHWTMNTYTITTIAGEGGTITGSCTVNYGSNKNIIITPNQGYAMSSIKIDGVSAQIKEVQCLTNIQKNITIEAVFTKEPLSPNSNEPVFVEGMIPVRWDGANWVITNTNDKRWYNYNSQVGRWANIMLRDGLKYWPGETDGEGTLTDIGAADISALQGKRIDNENRGSQFVWIPRYTYKFTAEKDVLVRWSNGVTDYRSNDYYTHPAFNNAFYKGGNPNRITSYNINSNRTNEECLNADNKLEGIWVAKYEASTNPTTSNLQFKEGSSLNSVIISESQNLSKEMIAENIASYGFISTDNVTIFNSHLIKNSEWAAVSYLYSSIGQNNNYIVMDMNAGLNEYVASYIEQIGGAVNNAVNLYGSSLKEGNTGTDIRDVDIISLTSPNDKPESNFGSSSSYKGNAVYETSASGTGNTSLNGESSIFTQKNEPFMIRTGYYGYDKTSGGGSTGIGFRTTLIIK